jgi:hypothetical protein
MNWRPVTRKKKGKITQIQVRAPGAVASSQQSHLAKLRHTEPGVHETRDAPRPPQARRIVSADRLGELGTADRRNRKQDLDIIAPSYSDTSSEPQLRGQCPHNLQLDRTLSALSFSGELCGVRVIPAVDVAVVQVKAARRCDGWAGWPVRLWIYGGSTCATASCTPAGRPVRSGRRRYLKIAATRPWAPAIVAAWNRISALAQVP